MLAVEARLLALLERHPNIITLKGFIISGGPIAFATEWPSCGTLRSFLQRDKAAVHHAPRLQGACAGVASAMAYLESLDIVHRALSIDCVAVCGSLEHVKVMGFGKAKVGWLGRQGTARSEGTGAGSDVSVNLVPVSAHVSLIFSAQGMARETYQQQVYKSTTSAKVAESKSDAVALWAPESLEDEEFSVKSDVWSFGLCVGSVGSVG